MTVGLETIFSQYESLNGFCNVIKLSLELHDRGREGETTDISKINNYCACTCLRYKINFVKNLRAARG